MAKPTNINDFMQQTGASFEDTVELLYGVVGSNNDTRDWNAIMASSDPLTAARAATGEMYSNAASTLVPNRDTTIVPNPTNQTSIVKYTSTADGKPREVYGIVAGDGTLLRGGFLNQETAVKQATNFGVKDANIIQSGNSFVEKADDTVRSGRPTVKEIMDRTGLSFQEAGGLLGNLISAERNTKLDPAKPAVRVNYGAIMGSQDPVAAARAATRQIRESASTAAYKLDPSRIVDRVDNFVLYKETTGEVPELQVRYAPNDSYTQGFGGFSVINAPGQDPNKRLQELGVGITQDQIKRLETAYNNYAAANPTYSPRAGVTVNIPYNNVFSTLTPVAENPYYTDQSFVSFGNIPEGYDLTAAKQIPIQAPQDIEPDYFAQKRTPTAQQQTATPQPVGQQPFAPPIPVAPAPTVQPTFNMGTSYLPAFAGQQPAQQGQQVPSSSTTYGTLPFTYTPTTPFTVGQTATQAQQPMTVGQPSEVRTYRNNSGLTVSITFVNGQPVTPIPSGFFPADQMQSQTSVPSTMQMTATSTPQMAMGGMVPSTQNIVSGFKPNAMQRIAGS